MLKRLSRKLFRGKSGPVRRMDDSDMPAFVPPGALALTPEEREARLIREWFARLPPDLRPYQLFELYPKIARQIIDLWGQPAQCNRYLDGLLIANREGRQGFPPAVGLELVSLGVYYKEKYQDLIGLRKL